MHNSTLRHSGRKRLPSIPVHTFLHEDSNGRHWCAVSEVLGPKAELYLGEKDKLRHVKGFRARLSRRISFQMAQAISLMRSVGLSHRDIKPSNIIFELDHQSINSWSQEELYQRVGRPYLDSMALWSGGDLPPSTPPYVVESMRLVDDWEEPMTENFKLIDFGGSRGIGCSHEDHDTGLTYCFAAPEKARYKPGDAGIDFKPADIWSLACTIFLLRSGEFLFWQFMGGPEAVEADWEDVSGKNPTDDDCDSEKGGGSKRRVHKPEKQRFRQKVAHGGLERNFNYKVMETLPEKDSNIHHACRGRASP